MPKGKKKTREEFVQEAIRLHGNTYNYKDFVFINMSTKGKIRCPKDGHGHFEKTPTAHIKGAICPKCRYIIRYSESFKSKCENMGVDYWRALKRREAGMPEEKIFESSYVRNERQLDNSSISIHGVLYPNLKEAVRRLSPLASAKTISRRIMDGLTPEEAFASVPNPGYRNGIIYLVSSTSTGKKYVGLTVMRLADRWESHLEQARAGNIRNKDSLHEAIRLQGASDFEVQVIDHGVAKNDLEAKEEKWIRFYNSLVPNGYNLNRGGASGGSNRKPIVIDGKGFASIGDAAEYVASSRGISFHAAKWRIRKDKLDVRSPSKPGEAVTSTKTYKAWSNIVHVSANPKSKGYTHAKVCERWRNFFLFKEDVGDPPGSNYVFTRIDKNGDYEPNNCMWAKR